MFVLCLAPFARLVAGAFQNSLGSNPIEAITRSTGWWALLLLMATLAVTPLRRVFGAAWLLRLRRMLGLFAFFYVCAHFLTFVWFDHWFDAMAIVKDVIKRPFITFGFCAFLLLLPLALTSSNAMVRRLGRNWQRLHRAVYAIALLGVVHYWWLVKRDLTEPALFALALAALLGLRLLWYLRRMRPATATATVARRPAEAQGGSNDDAA